MTTTTQTFTFRFYTNHGVRKQRTVTGTNKEQATAALCEKYGISRMNILGEVKNGRFPRTRIVL